MSDEDYSFHNDLLLKPSRGKYETLKIKLYFVFWHVHAAELSSGFTEQILISTWIKWFCDVVTADVFLCWSEQRQSA